MALDLNQMFTYHPPKPGQPERYTKIREKAKELAELVMAETPSCPEQTLAIRNIETGVFYANAAIARNG